MWFYSTYLLVKAYFVVNTDRGFQGKTHVIILEICMIEFNTYADICRIRPRTNVVQKLIINLDSRICVRLR